MDELHAKETERLSRKGAKLKTLMEKVNAHPIFNKTKSFKKAAETSE